MYSKICEASQNALACNGFQEIDGANRNKLKVNFYSCTQKCFRVFFYASFVFITNLRFPLLSYSLTLRKVCYTLLKLGADANSTDNNRWTPLMWASKLGWVKSCQELLEMQASPDDVNTDGDTALHIACKQGHVSIVNLLLESGASLNACNTQSLTCLEAAVRAGNGEVAMAMVKHPRYDGPLFCDLSGTFIGPKCYITEERCPCLTIPLPFKVTP